MQGNPVEITPKNMTCKIGNSTYPMVGFGTYRLQGQEGAEAIRYAMQSGYGMIDTATFYNNFDAIALALQGLDRMQFYIISKVWHDSLSPDQIQHDCEKTLNQMQTDHLDAYLIHWPNCTIPIDQTLKAMDQLRKENKIRHIGLSNVTVNHLKKALSVGVPITWVQVEMHPYFYDKALLDFCSKNSIVVQAWRPLNLGQLKNDDILIAMGKKHQKTPCQVALRWIVQHGCIPLPGSQNKKHILENLDISDFLLSEEEMQKLDHRASKGKRFRLNLEHGLGFSDEFDFSYEQCWPY